MTNTNTNKNEKETMKRMNDSADLHNKIMTKEETIKEFREKFVGSDGRIYSGTLTAGKIERFWLSKLQTQKQELLEKIRLRMIEEANTPLKERKSGWRILKEVKNFIK